MTVFEMGPSQHLYFFKKYITRLALWIITFVIVQWLYGGSFRMDYLLTPGIYIFVDFVLGVYIHYRYHKINNKMLIEYHEANNTIVINRVDKISPVDIESINIIIPGPLYVHSDIVMIQIQEYCYADVKLLNGKEYVVTNMLINNLEEWIKKLGVTYTREKVITAVV